MAKKFIVKQRVTEQVTVDVPAGSADDLRVLLASCSASDLNILRKVCENPALKAKAIGASRMFM